MKQHTQELSDYSLLQEIETGGNSRLKAIELLYAKMQEYSSMIRSKFRLDIPDSQETYEDIFMDSFVTLLDNIEQGKFRKEACLSTYFYSILRNKARSIFFHPSFNKVSSLEGLAEYLPDTSCQTDQSEIPTLLYTKVTDYIKNQELPNQELLQLVLFDQLTDEEIDVKMRIYNLKATRRMKNTALKQLRAHIQS